MLRMRMVQAVGFPPRITKGRRNLDQRLNEIGSGTVFHQRSVFRQIQLLVHNEPGHVFEKPATQRGVGLDFAVAAADSLQ